MDSEFILMLLCFGFVWWGLYRHDKKYKARLKETDCISINSFDYCGGSDYVAKNCKVELLWGNDGILTLCFGNFRREQIPFENISKITAKSEQQIKNDVTLTRLALFGVFAFGMKKETTDTRYFLVFDYNDIEGSNNNLILGGCSSLQTELDLFNKIIKEHKELKC